VASVTSDLPTLRSQTNRAAGGTLAGAPELEQLVHAGLAIADDRAVLRPQLAEAVPNVENGLWKVFPDGRMETSWRLRQGALWQDGTPITAADLLFTATVFQDRDLPLFRHAAFDSVESVEAPDERSLLIRWRKPYIDADQMFASVGAPQPLPLPRHLLERPYLENKAGFLELAYWGDEYVGAGPFKLREFSRGSAILLEANDRYVLGRPKIDVIEVRLIPEPNTLLANILGGNVELPMGRGVSFEHGLQLREQWRDGRAEFSAGGGVKIWPQLLVPNPPIVGDARFRRALLHAIDRQQLVDGLMAGQVEVAHSIITPADREYAELAAIIVRYAYDPRRAGQIIEGLGYSRGTDGTFRDGSNQRLTVEFRSSPMDVLRKTKLAVADFWKTVGVGVTIIDDSPQQRGDAEYRATFPGFDITRGNAGVESFRTFHSSEVRTPQTRYVGQNVPNYVNPELDTLIERYLLTIPRPERMAVAAGIVRHMTDQVVVLDQFYDASPTVVGSRLENVATTVARGGTNTWNAHEWDVTR
jgi:peptide/nickel transport system substrate-binding protein